MIRVLARVPDVIQRLGNFIKPPFLDEHLLAWYKGGVTADGLTLIDKVEPSAYTTELTSVGVLQLSGATAYCSCEAGVFEPQPTDAFTIRLMLFIDPACPSSYVLGNSLGTGDFTGVPLIYLDTGVLRFQVTVDPVKEIRLEFPVSTGAWMKLEIEYDGSELASGFSVSIDD